MCERGRRTYSGVPVIHAPLPHISLSTPVIGVSLPVKLCEVQQEMVKNYSTGLHLSHDSISVMMYCISWPILSILQAISKHFKTIRVSEKKAVPLFISMVKSHKSKLDQPKPMESS